MKTKQAKQTSKPLNSKPLNSKPLNSTQIKLLLGEMIRIHNERLVERNKVIERMKEKQVGRYRAVLTEMFHLGGFTESQIKALLSECWARHNKLGVKAIINEEPYEFHDVYREKGWNCESHPLHAILESTKLRLHMGTASDYETYLEEFTAEIEKLLK